jgi:hypothetical protein
MKNTMKLLCAFGLLVLPSAASWLSPGLAPIQEGAAKPTGSDAAVVEKQLPSYPLKTCPVSGEELGSMGEPVNYVHAGRLLRFCCKNCVGSFTKAPDAALKKIDEAVIADQGRRYPLKSCPVSGKQLTGEGAAPVDFVYGTKLVRLCCNDCKKEFAKGGDQILAKVDASWISAQVPSYPLEFCVITGKKLDTIEKPYNFLHGTRLVRLCCEDCRAEFQKSPEPLLAKIHAARQKDKDQQPAAKNPEKAEKPDKPKDQ